MSRKMIIKLAAERAAHRERKCYFFASKLTESSPKRHMKYNSPIHVGLSIILCIKLYNSYRHDIIHQEEDSKWFGLAPRHSLVSRTHCENLTGILYIVHSLCIVL